MKNKFLIFIVATTIFTSAVAYSVSSSAQNGVKVYPVYGLSVGSRYRLINDAESVAKFNAGETGEPLMIANLRGLEGKDIADRVLISVYVYDLNRELKAGKTSGRILSFFVQELKEEGDNIKYIKYQGLRAAEAFFPGDSQTPPCKAIYVVKGRRAYVIQVMTCSAIDAKFNALKDQVKLL